MSSLFQSLVQPPNPSVSLLLGLQPDNASSSVTSTDSFSPCFSVYLENVWLSVVVRELPKSALYPSVPKGSVLNKWSKPGVLESFDSSRQTSLYFNYQPQPMTRHFISLPPF